MKDEKPRYIKCPRCELNYILVKDKFCDVCKSEMKAGILDENDFDELEEGLELCPVCRVNYISEGETMCATCQEEQMSLEKDDEPNWRGFVDKSEETDDEEDLDLLPVEEDEEIDEELEGAFAKDFEDDFEDEEDEEDVVDESDLDDDFKDLGDDDFDDEDEEEDDEEVDDEDDLY